MITIRESGMDFGGYPEDNCFHIEKSTTYQQLSTHSIKSCEFILLKGNDLLFVEAKNTCPNYYEAQSTEAKKVKYSEYVDEIVQKMKDSLAVYASILLSRHDRTEVSSSLLDGIDGTRNIRLVLVVKSAEKVWLDPFPYVFQKKMEREMKIWNIREFIVINEEMAKRLKLVENYSTEETEKVVN